MDKVKYWVDISDYDYDTAEVMYQTGRYLYVGFCCHQAIEKIFKAYYELKIQATAPYTHNLAYLAEKGELWDLLSEEQKEFIEYLDPLNIKTRYPEYKEKILKIMTKENCQYVLTKSKELREWTKQKLSKN
jgi:HEPN domain-containing protein